MKPILLFLFALCMAGGTYAQNRHNLDSLSTIINTTKNIKLKIDALNSYAYEYRKGDKDSGKLFASQALVLSQKINYHRGIADYYNCISTFIFGDSPDSSVIFLHRALDELNFEPDNLRISQIYSNLGNIFIRLVQYDSAGYYARLALKQIENDNTADKNKKEYRMLWNYKGLGDFFYYTSVFDSSIFYLLKATQIAENIKDKNAEGSCRLSIANIYSSLKDYENAIVFTKEAFPLNQQGSNYEGAVLCLTNIGSYYTSLKKYQQAHTYVDSALLLSKAHNVNRYYSTNYHTLGEIERNNGDCGAALDYYKQALEYCDKYYNNFVRYETLTSMGDAYNCAGKPVLAIQNYTLVLEEEADDPERNLDCFDGLAKAYASIGNYRQAFEFQKKYTTLNDSLFNVTKTKIVNELNISYETEKKKQQVALLEKDNKLKEANLEKQEQGRNFTYAIIGVILLAGGYSFYRYRRRRRIQSEQEMLNERLRISRELHDDMGSTLGSISIYSEVAKNRSQKNENPEEAIAKIGVASRELIDKMSDIVWSINPNNESIEQLQNRMQTFAAMILTPHDIQYDFHADEAIKKIKLTAEERKNIFLIFKEAIHNIVKYAECKKVEIKLAAQNNQLEMQVKDDGKGFDIAKLAEADSLGGNGIKNMKARAETMHADFSISSKSNEGTAIKVVL